jgi:hypothetical protein
MKRVLLLGTALCLVVTACDNAPFAKTEIDDPPKPLLRPYPFVNPDNATLYTVKSYQFVGSPPGREYRMELESKDQVRFMLSCSQAPNENINFCGQGTLIPNDKVWAIQDGENISVYSNRAANEWNWGNTFWNIDGMRAVDTR